MRAAARVLGIKNAVSRSAYPGRDRRRISDNHPGASRRAPSCSQIGCSCTIARASWTLPPKSACRGCMRTGNCLIVVRRTGIWAVANPEVFQCCGFEECCPAAVSIYLLIDRGSRVVGIAILAGRLDNLRSAGVTTGLGSGIGTSATASGSRTSHWHIL